MGTDIRFDGWLEALETRHLADLTFPQVSSALRALSSTYVERRTRIRAGGALDGAGKRAAFALFYGPLHYLLVREIVRELGASAGRADPRTSGTEGGPVAGSVAPGWNAWRARVEAAGGRGDEWRFHVELPPIVAKLDRAAGLNHRELTGRSLWLA